MKYSVEPADKKKFTEAFDRAYSRFAGLYDLVVRWLPLWRRWISHALPEIHGPKALEVSFGTGYLMTQYAHRFEAHGVDYNRAMAGMAKRNLSAASLTAEVQQADVEHLPYLAGAFDSVVNTMSFTGYPDGERALLELRRVLKPGGRLILIDINYPQDRNPVGVRLVRTWARLGDLIRDMGALFDQMGFSYTDREIGGFGSVHLYVATKLQRQHTPRS